MSCTFAFHAVSVHCIIHLFSNSVKDNRRFVVIYPITTLSLTPLSKAGELVRASVTACPQQVGCGDPEPSDGAVQGTRRPVLTWSLTSMARALSRTVLGHMTDLLCCCLIPRSHDAVRTNGGGDGEWRTLDRTNFLFPSTTQFLFPCWVQLVPPRDYRSWFLRCLSSDHHVISRPFSQPLYACHSTAPSSATEAQKTLTKKSNKQTNWGIVLELLTVGFSEKTRVPGHRQDHYRPEPVASPDHRSRT